MNYIIKELVRIDDYLLKTQDFLNIDEEIKLRNIRWHINCAIGALEKFNKENNHD